MEPPMELEHRSHLIQVIPLNTAEPEMALACIDGEEKRKPTRIEKEHHKQALAFYYSLGKDRTLAKVAEAFGVKESLVLNWSSAPQPKGLPDYRPPKDPLATFYYQ